MFSGFNKNACVHHLKKLHGRRRESQQIQHEGLQKYLYSITLLGI